MATEDRPRAPSPERLALRSRRLPLPPPVDGLPPIAERDGGDAPRGRVPIDPAAPTVGRDHAAVRRDASVSPSAGEPQRRGRIEALGDAFDLLAAYSDGGFLFE